MKYYLQYHNFDKLGYLPGGLKAKLRDIPFVIVEGAQETGITTSKRMIFNTIGNVAFLIVGYGGRSKRYILWSWCMIEEIEEREDGLFDGLGIGRVLNPAPHLAGRPFAKFMSWNANFSLGFRDITRSSYCNHLLTLAREFGKFELSESYADTLNTIPQEIHDSTNLIEGAVRLIKVNAYERNLEARRQCIDHYGCDCGVCGFNFGKVYGPIAAGLIHVHHLRPLSELRGEYVVDPIHDLRPVCPNCHTVLHRRQPAYSIDELRALLQEG